MRHIQLGFRVCRVWLLVVDPGWAGYYENQLPPRVTFVTGYDFLSVRVLFRRS